MNRRIPVTRFFFKIHYSIIPALFFLLLVSHADAGKQKIQKSGKEYNETGQRVVTALNSGDAKAFTQLLDKKTLVGRVFEGTSQDTKTVKDLKTGLNTGLDQVGERIIQNMGQNARLTFVRTRYLNKEHLALVRLDLGDEGINYLDFVLRKDKTGAVKIIDWHDYAQGQLYTDSLRQAFALLLPKEKSLIQKLLGRGKIDKKTVKQFTKLAELAREQKFAEWLEQYNEVSDKLKYSRIMLVTRVMVASATGDEIQYRSALADVHKHLGDDPTLSLVLIDHYFYEGNYKAAHKALNQLKEYTGGDAAIDGLKANIYLMEKSYPKAIRYARIAIKKDSTYENAHWTLLDASVRTKKYKTAVKSIRRLEKDFGYEFNPDKLAKIEGYEAFAQSSAFAKWKGGK